MIEFLYILIFSISLYLLIYHFRKKISKSLGVIDLPDGNRKIHKSPTPKTGAYSISIIIFSFIILNFFFELFKEDFNKLLICTLCVFIVGLFDDKYNLRARKKIFLIIFISLALCLFSEKFVITKFYIHTYDSFFKLGDFSIIFTILCIFTLINSLNLADGINGLAIGLIFFWLIYINQIYANNLDLLINAIIISLILSFYHNYKGEHFLGDAGSLMLSSFIAFLIIYLYNQNIHLPSHKNSAENILILFIVPVLDMVRLFFERLINKKSPSTADKNHLHHYLIEKFSKKKALFVYFLSANIPILISINTQFNKIYIIGSIIILYSVFIYHYKVNSKKS